MKTIDRFVDIHSGKMVPIIVELLEVDHALSTPNKIFLIESIYQTFNLLIQYNLITNSILLVMMNFLKKNIYDNSSEVRENTRQCLLRLTQILTQENIDEYILPPILEYLHDSNKVNKIIALDMLNAISEKLSQEILHNFIANDLIQMTYEKEDQIRLQSFVNIIKTGKYFKIDFIKIKFIPIFE